VFKDMGAVLPGLRMKRVAQHCIFCVPQVSGPALSLAVLHQRMDLLALLKNRL
jgi:toxin ParE1/3/4